MAGPWDTPPTADEIAAAQGAGVWDAPPTPEEVAAVAPPVEPEIGTAEAAARALSSIGTGGLGTKTLGLRPASRMSGFRDRGPLEESERLRLIREQQDRDDAALRAHPVVSLAVGGPAAALSLPIGAASRAPSVAGRAAQAMGAGAKFGALTGIGTAKGDSAGEVAGNVALNTVGGAALGPVAQLGGEGLGALWSRIGPWIQSKLSGTAIEQGRKALSGISNPLAARKPVSEGAVQQALDTGAIRPFGTTAGAAQRLEASADDLGARYGEILEELAAQGVTGPNAGRMAMRLLAEAAEAEANTLGSVRPGLLRSAADEITTKPLVGEAPGGDLPLLQAERIKRSLQDEAKREYDKISRQYTTTGETKKDLAATVRAAIEESVREQADKAPQAAAAFEPVKSELSRTLEALRVAEEGAARAARRKPIGLSSTVAAAGMLGKTGDPLLAGATGVGHALIDKRIPSTLAWAANKGARAVSAVPNRTAPEVSGVLGEVNSEEFLRWLAAQVRPSSAAAGGEE
jgi:hypothetical protein